MHDLLYAKQKEWSNVLNARDFMLAYAKELNLNIDKFSADLKSSAIEDKIKAEYQEGMKLDVQGTPTFFVNGVKIENPQSVEAFSALIRAAAK
jgi:protein-disulfide isomerase